MPPCNRLRAVTLVEMLVVVCLISILLALAVPHLEHSSGRAVEAAAAQLRGAIFEARSRAIATRDVQHALVFIGEGSGALAEIELTSAGDPALPPRRFVSTVGTIVLVDENSRAGRPADALQGAGATALPEHVEFAAGAYPPVVDVACTPDGCLIVRNHPDRTGSSLRQDEGYYEALRSAGRAARWGDHFDLAIAGPSFARVAVVDLVPTSGDVDSLVYPR